MMVTPSRRATPELIALAKLFYPSLEELGDFQEVSEGELPETPRKLLWHDAHMTVTVEAHHKSSVDVRVLDTHTTATHYSRRILLTRQTDGRVVQFGIVRLNSTFLADEVRTEIESQQTPLGRILIEHNVLRHVRPLSLWRIEPGSDLVEAFGLDGPQTCYGRTALIYCNGLPAVELLEIVTPVES
jgi:chorismate-pyruvate lyase